MTSLRLITPPTSEPVSVETVKENSRIDLSDEDGLLDQFVAAAREQGENYSRRAFITQTLEMVLDEFPADNILDVWRPPLQSVTSVKYRDSSNTQYTLSSDYYTVDTDSEPGRIIFNTLPNVTLRLSGAIVVRYVAGYGDSESDVPWNIKQLLLQLIGHWYENRESMDVPREIRDGFIGERVMW